MVFDGANPPAIGCPKDHGHGEAAARPIAHACHVLLDLIERLHHEPGELNLRDGFESVDRHAHGGADDAVLGQRRVDNTILAVLLKQPFGDAVVSNVTITSPTLTICCAVT